MSTLNIIWRKE